MKKIKVLQIHPKYNIKSTDISDLGEQIFKALPKAEYYTVNGFLAGRPEEGEPISCADESIYFNFTNKQLKGLRLSALWTLYRYLKKEKFDVVICNRYKPVNMLLTLSRVLSIPLCIGIAHGFGDYDRAYRRKQVKKRINETWRFVGVSPAVRDYLINLKSGFTKENTLSITNAIDIQQAVAVQLSKEESRKSLKLPEEKILIGALGRLVPVKGHKYLIEAFSIIADDYPDVDLVIIGEGREKENLEKTIEKYRLKNRIHLTGYIEGALAYTKAFDIWVMPSLKEGLGLALLEGMTAGLPIIASDVPAMHPLVKGARGTLVEPANSFELANALSNMLKLTPRERLELGCEAFSYVEREHSLSLFKEQYLSLISRVKSRVSDETV